MVISVWYGNCYDMVWMVWYKWYGIILVWYGINGMVWMVWYDMAIPWYGIILVWYGMNGMAIPWYGIVLVWYCMNGMVWFHLWYDSIPMVWDSHSIWYDIPIPHRYDISIPPGMTFPFHLVWHSHSIRNDIPIPSGITLPYHIGITFPFHLVSHYHTMLVWDIMSYGVVFNYRYYNTWYEYGSALVFQSWNI